MLVSDLFVIALLAVAALLLLAARIFTLPYGRAAALVLTLAALGVYFARGTLPGTPSLPLNTFAISYHNVPTTPLKALGASRKVFSTEPHTGTAMQVEGFAGKQLYYDRQKDFYVVMDGVFFMPVTTEKSFHFHLGWAKAELQVDDGPARSVDRTQSVDHTFSPGFHRVTVTVYNTDTVVTKMYVSMTPYEPVLPDADVTAALKPFAAQQPNLYYAFGYGSKTMVLPDSKRPTVLFLRGSAGGPAFWRLQNAAGAHLKAVVYSGVGNTVKPDAEGVLLLRAARLPELTKLPDPSECQDYAPLGFGCRNGPEKLERLNAAVARYAGGRLTGFTPARETPAQPLPQIVLDDEEYARLAQTAQTIASEKSLAQQRRKDPFFDREKARWSELLNVDDTQVPTNAFRAYYMKLQAPDEVVRTEIVPRVALKYSNPRKFLNIPPDDFLALWIGDFTFEKETTLELTLAVSWANAHLIIDGETVYDGGSDQRLSYTFAKGKHRIEIEYRNNYGQVDFVFDMLPAYGEVGDRLKTLMTPETKVYLFGTYGIDRSDHTLDLRMEDGAPAVLFVASYEPIRWNVRNAAHLKAVVVSSHEPGSSVVTDAPNVPVYRDARLRYAGRLMPYCYDGPTVQCENKNAFGDAVGRIASLTGRRPDGFSSTSEPSFGTKRLKRLDQNRELTVPQKTLDETVYAQIDAEMRKLDAPEDR